MPRADVKYEFAETVTLKKELRFNEELGYGEKFFYAEIEAISKDDKVHFSPKSLSKYFKCNPLTVTNWVKKLAKENLIEVGIDIHDEICKQFIKIVRPKPPEQTA